MTNDSARAVNVRRPAAEQFYAVALAAQCKIRVVPSEGIQDDRDLYSNGTHHKGINGQTRLPASCMAASTFPVLSTMRKFGSFGPLKKGRTQPKLKLFLSTYYHSTMPLAY